MAVDVLNAVNMNCELLATCNALGYLEGRTYQKEPGCLETMKDLIRFLRREDEKCDIRRQLGHAQILQNDLIPLSKQYPKEEELFETCIRLLVNLTQPAELCFQNVPDDKTFRNYFLEVQAFLQAYKQAFACEEFMSVLARKLKKLLDMEWESRREDHTLLMERILLLVRNILHIPADPNAEKRTDDDASIHDQVLWALNVSGMDKLILYIASAEGEQQWCMHAIEIISHMLREQTPETIAKAGTTKQASERLEEERELERLRLREVAEKKARLMKASSRHSRFGGSFYMTNFKSISERDLIYHRPLQQAKTISFETNKGPTKKPKNRLPLKDGSVHRRSTLSIRLFLKDFCILFLDNCYNPLMYSVKDHILHRRAQENDESYYLWAMHFFMQFSRLHRFRVDVISETFSVQAFHYVNTQIIKYLDMMVTEKKEATAWAKRMHLGLKAYRELLATLNEMTGPNSPPELRESGDVVQSNVFYVIEYREIFVTLLKKFDETKSTRVYLKDLVESTHIYIKMLEHYSKSKKTLIVQKKTKKKAKRRKRRGAQQHEAGQSHNAEEQEEQLAEVWDGTLAGELSGMLQGREDIPEDVVPFDAASEQPVEEQRTDAMVRIQQSLRAGRAGEGLALFRAAREVWPDGEVFGAADVEPEDEFMALREIHFTNLNVPAPPPPPPEEEAMEEEQEEEDEEDEMVEEERGGRGEEEFNFKVFINKFSHPDVLKSYIKLLSGYRDNTDAVNHYIVKMLHRVALECDKTQLLFQVSLFRIFHKILQDPLAKSAQLKEMAKFGQFVVSRFFKALPTNPKLVVELLFWKDARGIYEIQEGYGAEMPSKKSKAKEWTEEEEAELAGLYEQYRDVDGAEKDVVDLIMEHLIDDMKTRRQIITQLVKQELVDSAKDLKKTKGAKRVTLWREEHELELRTLFDQFRDSNDVLGSILENMKEKRSKNKVMEKILALGLVQDRKELYKRRQRKRDGAGDGSTRRRRRRTRRGGDDEEDDDEDDEELGRGLTEFPDSEPEYMTSTDGESGNDINDDDNDDEDDGNDEDDAEDAEGDEEKSLEELVVKVQRKGLAAQLSWIQEGLRRTAEDREEGGDTQAIPIVPLVDGNHTAIGSKTFQCLMKKIGLSEPRSHEEVYWRIPGEVAASSLRDMADSIEPKESVEPAHQQESRKKRPSKKSNARFQMLKKMALSKREEKKKDKGSARERRQEARVTAAATSAEDVEDPYGGETDVSGEDEEEEDIGSRPKATAGGHMSRIKRSLPSDSSSDDSDDDNLSSVRSKGSSGLPSQPAKRSRLVLSDDSEGESDGSTAAPTKTNPIPNPKPKKPTRLVSSDEEESDNESEEEEEELVVRKKKSPVTRKNTKKQSLVIESDESDEEVAKDDEDDDSRSEIIEVVSAKRKPALKRQSPFDYSDEEEEEDDEQEDESKAESSVGEGEEEVSPTQDRSLHLVLSEDSPSDADVTMKDAVTTETDEDEEDDDDAPLVMADAEDNASNFQEDATSNVADDNVDSNIDNKASSDEEEVSMEMEGVEDEGEWEEIVDDDSDIDMTPSNQTTSVASPQTQPSQESDSDDDVPLRKVAKRKVVSSDSDDE